MRNEEQLSTRAKRFTQYHNRMARSKRSNNNANQIYYVILSQKLVGRIHRNNHSWWDRRIPYIQKTERRLVLGGKSP